MRDFAERARTLDPRSLVREGTALLKQEEDATISRVVLRTLRGLRGDIEEHGEHSEFADEAQFVRHAVSTWKKRAGRADDEVVHVGAVTAHPHVMLDVPALRAKLLQQRVHALLAVRPETPGPLVGVNVEEAREERLMGAASASSCCFFRALWPGLRPVRVATGSDCGSLPEEHGLPQILSR